MVHVYSDIVSATRIKPPSPGAGWELDHHGGLAFVATRDHQTLWVSDLFDSTLLEARKYSGESFWFDAIFDERSEVAVASENNSRDAGVSKVVTAVSLGSSTARSVGSAFPAFTMKRAFVLSRQCGRLVPAAQACLA